VSYEDFTNNKILYFAVIKNIEIIGEASYMLSSEFKDAHPGTQWKVIAGMRHYIVHGYYQINDRVVWNVITNDIPVLREQVISYLSELEHE
jgi:uncharacterized protein with HEPN domain